MAKVTQIAPVTINLKRKKRVAAYVRVSKDTENLLHSFATQVSYFSSLIQKNGEWEYAGVYSDEGITGTKMDDREGFNRLMADCKAGKVDIVLTKSISRWARNTVDLLASVRHLRSMGVEVRFEREGIRTMSGDGEVMLSILASFAQEESRSISENSKWGIRKRYEQGIPHVTRRTFGYQWDGESYQVVAEEAAVVKMVFERFAAGESLGNIAKEIGGMGVVGVNGNPLVEKTLYCMIRNEIYVGKLVLQKKYSADPLTKENRRNKGELPQYCVEGAHEAIVSDELFAKVQKAIGERRGNTQNQYTNPTSFSGKVYCSNCGNSCRRNSQRNGNTTFKVWRCRTKEYGTCKACNLKNVYESELEQATLGLNGFNKITVSDEKLEIMTTEGRKIEWLRQ